MIQFLIRRRVLSRDDVPEALRRRDHAQALRPVFPEHAFNGWALGLAVGTPVRPEEEEHHVPLELVEPRNRPP